MLSRAILLSRGLLLSDSFQLSSVAGIKYFPPPKNYDDIEIPDRQRLRVYDKVPNYPANLKPPKMQKRLRYMRGPELVHNTLQLKQYGIVISKQFLTQYCTSGTFMRGSPHIIDAWRIDPPWQPVTKKWQGQRMGEGKGAIDHYVTPINAGRIISLATGGGRMRHEHYEMARLVVARHLNQKIMFAIWRIDPPWQPVTKKGQGQRMGGGKGAIDHYVTPIKAGRIILEVGGKCEYEEVENMLRIIADRLPFKAEAVSQEIMEKKAAEEKWAKENNQNHWTMEYIIKNNMGGCHKMLSPFDHKWLGKYL